MSSIFHNKKKILIALVVIFTLLGYILAYHYYTLSQSLKKTPDQVAEEQAVKLTAEISKLMQLPTDETPSVVTITDTTKVSSQPFFKNAQNGDALLVYSKNMEAIIYRPSTNKIIQVGPIYNEAPSVPSPVEKTVDTTTSTSTKKTK